MIAGLTGDMEALNRMTIPGFTVEIVFLDEGQYGVGLPAERTLKAGISAEPSGNTGVEYP